MGSLKQNNGLQLFLALFILNIQNSQARPPKGKGLSLNK